MKHGSMTASRGVIAALVLFFSAVPSGGIFAEPLEGSRAGAGEDNPFGFKKWILDPPDNPPATEEAEEADHPSGLVGPPPGEQDAQGDAEILRPEQGDGNPLEGLEALPDERFDRPREEVDPELLRGLFPPGGPIEPIEVDPDQLGEGPAQPGARLSPDVQLSSFGRTYHRELGRSVRVSLDSGMDRPSFPKVIVEMAQAGQSPPATVPPPEATCDASRSQPLDLQRSLAFWRQTEDGASCSAAVKDIRSLREEMMLDRRDNLHDAKLFDPEYICASRNRHQRTIVERYTDSCLYRLSDAKQLNLISEQNRETILSAIGIIGGIGQHCIGTVSKRRVYTSRHCFLRVNAEGKVSINFPSREFYLRTFAGNRFRLAVPDDVDEGAGFGGRESDWIALPFAPNQDEPVYQIALRPDLATDWRPLLLVSLHRYLAALSMCDGKTQSEEEFIDASLIVDITPGCTIFAQEGYLVYHGCQTQKGMSGTPLLTIVEDELVLVAIHAGASKALQTPCSDVLAKRFPNYGVVPRVMP